MKTTFLIQICILFSQISISQNKSSNNVDLEAFKLIAGSQVVVYSRTSYISDNSASSLSYYNFCKNGTFFINYDGSFSVEGTYGGNAHGSSSGVNYGNWKLVKENNETYMIMTFANGSFNKYSVNKKFLKQGRWRIGNVQYAIQRNKVNCKD